MHIIIAFLTAVGTILYFLDKAGIDIGWLNPWAWRHRRQWRKKLYVNPAFSLESPMEAIALLLTATAKIDGDISLEEKKILLSLFESTFNLSAEEASALLGSSVYILKDGMDVYDRAKDVLAPSLERFSEAQKVSSLELLKQIASVSGQPSQRQQAFIRSIEEVFMVSTQQEAW